MRVLKGTLTFVLGMVIGIILFVVAIGGTVAILATQMTVGQIQQAITGSDDIISSDSNIYDKTILEAVQDVINDVQNFDKLSLKTLYEHYGIKLLNGISGIDFTDKDFYSVAIPDLINDLSIVVNSFTLNDVSKIAGVDFASYGLPILTNNLNSNLSTAMDNILGSLNGNLTIRDINTNFGIDIGIDDNPLLSTVQDVVLSEFGNVMTVLRVSSILEADTDTFVPYDTAELKRYVATDLYEPIPASELASRTPLVGVETSLIGGKDTDGDGKADKMNLVETRYVEEIFNEDGSEVTKYVVDNSSYATDFDFENNNKTFFRHKIYEPAGDNVGSKETYVLCYGNRIDSINGDDYTLVEKGFYLESELDFTGDKWAMTGDVLDKDSKLALLEDGETADKMFTRVKVGESTTLLQSIAHMTVGDLQDADNLLDGMTVGDVIEITPDSAKIMKSLVARNCKITELGEVANDLTLGEMIDVVTYKYVACTGNELGRYVRIEDVDSYTLYDKTNPDMQGAQRFKKLSDGSFVPDPNGKFVHSIYYTLYNPAEHSGMTRYNRVPLSEGENVSSALLQRFMGATLGGFSNAFDSLMLADVMQIDADVYKEVDAQYIKDHKDERYFYYDVKNSVYRVASADYIKENPAVTIYHIAYSGESTSFLKKLAYVKIDKMADAMDIVIDDMMLSEIVKVYEKSAVSLSKDFTAPDANAKYFVDKVETVNGIDYAYVYDINGDYMKANFRAVELKTESAPIKYNYVKYTSADAEILAKLTLENNLFCLKDGVTDTTKEESFMRNRVLATYMITKGIDKVYYRVATTGDGIESTANVYKGATPQYGIYVRDAVSGYLLYDSENPAFADMPLYTFEKANSMNFDDLFFVEESDVKKLAIVLKDKGFIQFEGTYYSRRVCEDVYVLTEETENTFVYIDGQYPPYDPAIHDSSMERYELKRGYIGTADELFDKGTTDFDLSLVTYIRERSAPVLRLLARGTLGEMPNIIGNATVGDILDPEPDTLFDKDIIKNAKITELGSVFRDILTTMTVGELMTWSDANIVDDKVKVALDGITIQTLFSSFVIDEITHEIKVDMLKLYGYTA